MSYQGKAYGSREKKDAARAGKPARKWNPNWGKKAAPVVRGSAYKAISSPSEQQRDIFQHVANSTNHLIVQALAGTGKTATSVECMNKCVPAGKSILYVIFANRNAREAESKCFERIEVRTCHAFGLSVIKAAFGKGIEVDATGEKSRNIAQALLGPEDEKIELRYHFCKAMSLAKGYLCETAEQVLAVCDKHEVEFGDMSETEFCETVIKGLALSAKQNMRVEFDDMIWFPIKLNLTIPTYDYVFADECQDLSPARRELVLRAVRGGKLIAVGDKNQAIFGFTGADSESIDNIQVATNADVLPLHTTYRCGKRIVALAQSIVPEYTAADTNPEGVVADKTMEDMMREPGEGGCAPGDFVLSRTNAPLVGLCLQFVKQGRRATVQGKDLGKNLIYMIKRSNAQSVDGFLTWLDEWQSTECERLVARNKPCDHIVDKADCLRVFCEGERDLSAVRARIEAMFSDEEPGKPDTAQIVLSTVHKAKGLERDRVWIVVPTFKCVGPDENNVWYVALTRAKTHLFMVKQ